MTSSVSCYKITASKTFVTFCALVSASVNIFVTCQCVLRWKTFLTYTAHIHIFFSVYSSVSIQIFLPCKPFVTHCIQMRSWLVIMLSDIFCLNLKRLTVTCATSCSIKLSGTACRYTTSVTYNCKLIIPIWMCISSTKVNITSNSTRNQWIHRK